MRNGMAFLTEDRKETGCFLVLGVQENMQIAVLRQHFTHGGVVAETALNAAMSPAMSEQLRIKTPTLRRADREPLGRQSAEGADRALAADQPARSSSSTSRRAASMSAPRPRSIGSSPSLSRQGVAVVMISSEMPEILGMSDRIMVMHEGQVTGFLDREEADQVKIMDLAAR